MNPCTGLDEMFLPDAELVGHGDDRQTRPVRNAWAQALDVCAGCSSAGACLEGELRMMREGFRTVGIVGGTTPSQRRAMVTRSELNRVAPYLREPCGTTGGYAHHLNHGEDPCAECKRANARAKADRKRKRQEARKASAEIVLFPPVDWSVMRPARAAALAESWRLRGVVMLEQVSA